MSESPDKVINEIVGPAIFIAFLTKILSYLSDRLFQYIIGKDSICRLQWCIDCLKITSLTGWNPYKCLSVSNSGILSVVCRSLCPAYTILCRGLGYLPKVRYIILVDPLWDGFLIFETVFLSRSATLPYVWKQYHKNEWRLRLVTHIFTKLSQNVCLINIHILINTCQMLLHVMESLLILLSFWVFLYIFDDHSCLNCGISTKLSLKVKVFCIDYVSNQY